MMTEDFTAFFDPAEFAVTARVGAVQALVIYDENGAIAEQYGVAASGPVFVCPSTQWPGLAVGASIDIDLPAGNGGGTVTFRARSVLQIDDGAIKLVTLARL